MTRMLLASAARSDPFRSASSRPVILASSSSSSRCPTASAASTLCAAAGRRSTRAIRASRNVLGSGPRPSALAATSSSTNSGYPSERANTRSTRSSSGAAPSRLAQLQRHLDSRQRRELDAARDTLRRSSSASSGRTGWRRCSSSARYVATTSIRSVLRLRPRNARNARVALSRPVKILDREHRSRGVAEPRRAATATPRTGEPGRSHPPVPGPRRPPAPSPSSAEAPPARTGERRDLREHRIAIARERAQHGDDRRVGQLALAELDAIARQYATPRSRARPLARRAGASCPRRVPGHETGKAGRRSPPRARPRAGKLG